MSDNHAEAQQLVNELKSAATFVEVQLAKLLEIETAVTLRTDPQIIWSTSARDTLLTRIGLVRTSLENAFLPPPATKS
jgi:hypothetical protein